MYEEDCELCKLCQGNVVTGKYYENDTCIIVDCRTCKTPMLVFKGHQEPSKKKIREMEWIAKKLFPRRKIDKTRRKIHDHFHFHCR